MTDLTDTFVEISLPKALFLASSRSYLETKHRERLLVASFSDGLEIAWQSECSGPYSDETPDIDWEPPTVWVRKVKK